jgi:predicted ATPase
MRNNQRIPLAVLPGELGLARALITQGTMAQPALARVVSALGAGRVHVPFDIRPGWLLGSAAPMRLPAQLGVAGELERLGNNLANCYHKLLNGSTREDWERTLERVRAGIGADVVNVRTPAVGPSLIQLVIDFRGIPQPIPAFALSDGQLAYLAFVALAELGKDHSFLAFDEPESHMHPELLVRIVWLLEELAESCPVVLSTHSDRLLDALSAPAKSVVLCELDASRSTQLYRPAPEALEKWLTRYRGLGELRSFKCIVDTVCSFVNAIDVLES